MFLESPQIRLLEGMQSWPDFTLSLARLFSALGDETFYLLLLPLLLWFGHFRYGLAAARAVILADLIGEWIKWTLGWSRPPLRLALAHETSPGFVSTHAALSITVATVLWQRWPRQRPWLVLWVLGVGWSRLRLGVHFPADVLGGWLLGMLVGWLMARFRDSDRWHFATVGLGLLFVVLWPEQGVSAWHRDLGLLLGLEAAVVLGRFPAGAGPARMKGWVGLLRLLGLMAVYFGGKSLGWPRLVRYLAVGFVTAWRGRRREQSSESA